MKKAIIGILIILLMCCVGLSVEGQPNPGGGGGGAPVGGGAPIGSGIISLICLGVSYALIKAYKRKTRTP